VGEVQRLFQVKFRLGEFFSASTLSKFAALIDERRNEKDSRSNGRGRITHTRNLDWSRQRMSFLQREAELPRYIAPARGLSYQPAESIQQILLTGATGFLGTYLVAEILRTTPGPIFLSSSPTISNVGLGRATSTNTSAAPPQMPGSPRSGSRSS